MSAVDLEAEYNNRARVPEHPALIAGWASDAAAYRESHPPRLIAYGPGAREQMDVFDAGAGPCVMFIHGGYWQALDKSYFSHMARGLNARGVSVAVPSYDLCPGVRVGDIVEQMRAACLALQQATTAKVIASGHSAGGHLAACLLATEECVPAAYAISGLFDLTPLISTSINAALRLDNAEAQALSPLYWPAPEEKLLDLVVGSEESGEYVRQSRLIADEWGEQGVETHIEALTGANHFTVIAPMADPTSPMVARLRDLTHA